MEHATVVTWPAGEETDRNGLSPESLRAQDVRRKWDERIRLLRTQLQAAPASLAAGRLLETLRQFEAAIHAEQRALLASTLLWMETEQVVAQWVQGCYQDLARTAADGVARAAPEPGADAPARLAAVALACIGNAMKWAEIAESPREAGELVEAKRVHEAVVAAGLDTRAPLALPHGQAETAIGLDGLFVRALLLDAFCRGNLGPRQIEIADSWLWEWSGDYALGDRATGTSLVFDRHGFRGLRAAETSEPRDDSAFLDIAALGGHIAKVVRGFRDGLIFPGYGCAAEFRVEEHVATLDFLRRFLDNARHRTGRPPRRGRSGRVEAFLGLTEILAKAFAPRPESDQAASGADSPVRAAIDSRFDIPRRHVRLLDDSAFGVGVVCEDHALHAAEVGSLIALRDADGPPPLLCEVARRSGPGGPGTPPAQLGLRVLSRHPGKLAVQMAGSAKRLDALYLPGEDRSGYQDSLLVSQTDFTPGGELKVTLTDRAFVLRMSRVRYHGAGWQLVGFEVIEETAGEAASPGAPA